MGKTNPKKTRKLNVKVMINLNYAWVQTKAAKGMDLIKITVFTKKCANVHTSQNITKITLLYFALSPHCDQAFQIE